MEKKTFKFNIRKMIVKLIRLYRIITLNIKDFRAIRNINKNIFLFIKKKIKNANKPENLNFFKKRTKQSHKKGSNYFFQIVYSSSIVLNTNANDSNFVDEWVDTLVDSNKESRFFELSLYFTSHLIGGVLLIVGLLISVAFYTLVERKVMASMQRRKGPNVTGIWGFLQPLADGLKLVLKESVIPSKANKFLFVLAPVITFVLSLVSWSVLPLGPDNVFSNINLSLLFIFALSSFGVYGIILAGWASNSKYAFLGAIRSTAQMISYEVSLGFVFIGVVLCSGSLNLYEIVEAQQKVWYCFPLLPLLVIFFISALAETNRAPFDLPEAEAEIVAGYNVEYSGFMFALFFLGEYANMILMSFLSVLLFFGGWLPVFNLTFIPPFIWLWLKVMIFLFLFIWVRATVPRVRYDQLMGLGWKVFLPLTLGFIIFEASLLYFFDYQLFTFTKGYFTNDGAFVQLSPEVKLTSKNCTQFGYERDYNRSLLGQEDVWMKQYYLNLYPYNLNSDYLENHTGDLFWVNFWEGLNNFFGSKPKQSYLEYFKMRNRLLVIEEMRDAYGGMRRHHPKAYKKLVDSALINYENWKKLKPKRLKLNYSSFIYDYDGAYVKREPGKPLRLVVKKRKIGLNINEG